MLTLKFRNVSNQFGIAKEWWQALLWIEAEFSVEVSEGVLLSESHWCIVELAEHLAHWCRGASEDGPAFYYTSMDDAQEGLLWFRPEKNGMWSVGSAWQEFEGVTLYTFPEILCETMQYMENVIRESSPYLSWRMAEKLKSVCS